MRQWGFAADWDGQGRGAGIRRNAEMLAQGCPSAVLACPGGRGTADMVERAALSGLPVLRLTEPWRDTMFRDLLGD